MIDLITTVRPTLRSASITVESSDPSALECIATYHIEVEPTVAGQPIPPPVNSTSNTIVVSELNFCKSNYSFSITARNRNNITFNDSVVNVSGDLNGIIIYYIIHQKLDLCSMQHLTYSSNHFKMVHFFNGAL